jgi:hypothetical protein
MPASSSVETRERRRGGLLPGLIRERGLHRLTRAAECASTRRLARVVLLLQREVLVEPLHRRVDDGLLEGVHVAREIGAVELARLHLLKLRQIHRARLRLRGLRGIEVHEIALRARRDRCTAAGHAETAAAPTAAEHLHQRAVEAVVGLKVRVLRVGVVALRQRAGRHRPVQPARVGRTLLQRVIALLIRVVVDVLPFARGPLSRTRQPCRRRVGRGRGIAAAARHRKSLNA